MSFRVMLGSLSAAVMLAGCATSGGSPAGGAVEAAKEAVATVKGAVATIESKSGSEVKGVATFTVVDGKVTMVLQVTDAPPGLKGLHLHEKGDCGGADAAAAGSHWNPHKMDHGKPGEGQHHLGDMGNLEVGADGKGSLTYTTDAWAIGTGGENDIVGRAVIIHENTDDFSQPTGNAGARIGCGVIKAN